MAVWPYGMGKYTSAVCMYISRYENITMCQTRHLQTILDVPFHKNENQFDVLHYMLLEIK